MHVGICGINSINWIYTFFAILKLGALAVLINPGLKPNEVLNVCNIGGVSALCYAEIEGKTTYDMYKNVCLDNKQIKAMYNFSSSIDYSTQFNTHINNQFKDIFHVDDACVIIYTSGSTGKPKAVLASAYSIMYSIKPIIDNVKHTADDNNLAFLPFFHVFGLISSIVAALLIGFASIIPASKSPKELISLIDKYKVTLFNTVPTMLLAILQNSDFSKEKLSSLRSTMLGGSITTKDQMILFCHSLPNNHFANIYGMSEIPSISITNYNDTLKHISETVGKPLDGTIIVVKDEKGNIVNTGTQGELCVKSGGMLVWYYKLPLDMQPIEDGYLRTGDLGYIDEDGYIRLTGRIKDLIIRGGENISPSEVAEALLSLNHFVDVKVVGVPDTIKGEVIAAAIIPKPDYIFNEDQVKKELENILARYKQPVLYKVFNSFPLLGTGKIDTISLINKIINDCK